jgi:hypothetical protein
MKKNFLIIAVILIVLVIILGYNYKISQASKNEILKFNSAYEEYNLDTLNGLDITTVINKATSNNEKYEIEKDESGYYNLDDENSIEIYVTIYIDATTTNTYKMEKINAVGMSQFTYGYGQVSFECKDVTYHKNGKIASMTFEAKSY